MPTFCRVAEDYVPRGDFRVWSKGSKTYSWNERGKFGSPNSERQKQFEQELLDLSAQIGSKKLPVYVSWPNANRRRMDWGNIGHAVASGFLEVPQDNEEGYVSHVTLRGL